MDLKEVIRTAYQSLPENQRKVADFLVQHTRDIAFLSIADVEQRSGASKATVVRLAQSLGFTGYNELRAKLREGVQHQIRLKDKFPLLSTTDHEAALTIVARQDVRNINQTINNLDKETFHTIAAMILKSSHVYTMGLGISSLMSQILAYSLNQVAVKATPFVHDYETFAEQMAFVKTSDLLIAFSFPPYSKETVDTVKFAHDRGIPVVAITDRVTSPVSFFSTKLIPIRSQNLLFTNSFSAISVVINALATEVAVRNKPKALKMMKEIDQQLEDLGHYTTG
ncbi:MAG: MurR/RpiR family transcriptional regulator [Bacteroidota bacterium]